MKNEFIQRRKTLRKALIKKFGTMSQFCREAGVDRTELQILFAVKAPNLVFLKRIEALAVSVKPKPPEGVLEPSKLKALQEAINAAGGVRPFCRENKAFKVQTVYQVVAGMYQRRSPKVEALLKHFGI